jgi:hypothetical protein
MRPFPVRETADAEVSATRERTMSGLRVRDASRERDDEILLWVRLRARGWTVRQIADRFNPGGNPQYIRTLTDRVRDQDMLGSGEDSATVKQSYWSRT